MSFLYREHSAGGFEPPTTVNRSRYSSQDLENAQSLPDNLDFAERHFFGGVLGII
jgi:hypothetical protein